MTSVSIDRERPNLISKYMGLIRFSHTIFALPFALLATVWAYILPISSSPLPDQRLSLRWLPIVGIIVCMVTARSFAMAINRLLDHDIDAANPRTAGRHLPAGELSRRGVTGFSILAGIAFLGGCALFLPNTLPLILSLPVLGFLAAYSLTKRFTRLAHFWLGVALMLAPLCAWIALRGEFVIHDWRDIKPVLWLGGIVLFWVAGFDIIYACQDYEFDKQAGLHSIPAKLGIPGALFVAKISHAIMWIVAMGMSFAVPELSLGWMFRLALAVVGGLLVWQHASVSERSLDRVNFAFFQLNSVISVVFLAVGSLDAWLR